MKKILSNKKGITDVFYIIGSLFALGFFIYLFLTIGGSFNEKFTSKMSQDEDFNLANETYTEIHQKNVRMADYLFLGAFFTLALGLIFVSFFIRASPPWVILFIFLTIIATIGSATISNYYQATVEKPAFYEHYNEVPMTNWIMENLVLIVLGLCITSIIVIYGKPYYMGGATR